MRHVTSRPWSPSHNGDRAISPSLSRCGGGGRGERAGYAGTHPFIAFPRLALALLLSLLPLFASRPPAAIAQSGGPQVTASVDQERISTDQVLTLRIEVRGASDVSRPDVEGIAGFQVVGSSSASQFSVGSGGIESLTVLSYQLEPTQLGQLSIGPLTLRADGREVSTAALTVTVVPGRRPTPDPSGMSRGPGSVGPLPGQVPDDQQGPYTLEAEAWPRQPYQGEQVAYTLRVKQWAETGVRARYQAPAFNGFWNASPEPERRQSIQDQGGRPARVTEFTTLLFPTQPGSLAIPPAKLEVPSSFWGSGFSLESATVELAVRPLPEGAPEGFGGAVGRFSLSAQVDATEVAAGEPLRLLLTVAGEGLIETLPEPVWPQLPAGWRWIEGQSGAQQETKGGRVTGSRNFERFVVPEGEGAAQIPPIVYVYFDPELESYQEARTEAIGLKVKPRAGTPEAGGTSAQALDASATIGSGAPSDAGGAGWQARPDLGLGALAQAYPLAKAAADWAADARPREAAAALHTLLATEAGLDRRQRARLLLALCEAEAEGETADWGRARLAWERAERLDPGAARGAAAGPCARLPEALPPGAKDDGGGLASLLAASRRWLRDGSLLSLALALAAAAIALALAARHRPALADPAFLLGLACLLGFGLYGLRRWEDRYRPRAIVLTDAAPLLAAPGPGTETQTLAALPAGSPVNIVARRGAFVEVVAGGPGLRGWLAEGSLATVTERE